ncbi:MAG TPA: hypothetical protein VGU65_12585 [Frateuria sp.]|uniref:hypothetical protein n=1 Tax=Frateuria sp. TaxID=2211372 RepID=UPI002DE74B92|nr:hypothetical protein [Frateuria sp.]
MLNSKPSQQDVVSRLQAQLAAEEFDVDTARRRHDELALAAADGTADPREADKAHGAFVTATQRHDRTARTLEAAQARAAEQARAAAREAQDAELSQCVALAEKRAKAADATQAGIKHLAELIDKQRQAEIAFDRALPANFGTAKRDGLYLEADELRASVRHEFDRLQMFGGPPPWHEHRPYAVKFHESVAVMRRRRAALLGLPE